MDYGGSTVMTTDGDAEQLGEDRARRWEEERDALTTLRQRMAERERRMQTIDAQMSARRQNSRLSAASSATAFAPPEPAARRAGMPPSTGDSELYAPLARESRDAYGGPVPPTGGEGGDWGPEPPSYANGRPPPPGGGSELYGPSGSFVDGQSRVSAVPRSNVTPGGSFARSAVGYARPSPRQPPPSDAPTRKSRDVDESTIHPWDQGPPPPPPGPPPERQGLSDACVWALAIGSGLVVGGAGGWLVGWGLWGIGTKGVAAKAVLSAPAGGGHAAPVAVSAAAAGATSSAANAAMVKGSTAVTAVKGSVAQAGAATFTAADTAGTAAATQAMNTATAATLATPYVIPAVAATEGVGVGSVCVGCVVGGVFGGTTAVVATRPKRAGGDRIEAH